MSQGSCDEETNRGCLMMHGNAKDTISIGIESTSHTFGIGICEGKKIIANVKDTYIPEAGWGIKPDDARKHHEKVKDIVLEKALLDAGICVGDADIISLAAGPGLPPCLVTGMEFAKSFYKPIIEVN